VSFGQRLKAHRAAAKLRQRELTQKTGLPRGVVSKYEQDVMVADWITGRT
jgi:transcriptional regulator with XRE-family HTH domain